MLSRNCCDAAAHVTGACCGGTAAVLLFGLSHRHQPGSATLLQQAPAGDFVQQFVPRGQRLVVKLWTNHWAWSEAHTCLHHTDLSGQIKGLPVTAMLCAVLHV